MAGTELRVLAALGYPAIDREHQVLVKAMVQIHDAILAGRGAAVIGPMLDLLIQFSSEHFESEEALMREHGYSGVDRHAAAHREMSAALTELRARAESDHLPAAIEAMDLIGRMAEHVERYDRAAIDEIKAGQAPSSDCGNGHAC